MKTLTELCIIFCFGYLGEIVARMLPFTMPASILGLFFLLFCLRTGLIKIDMIKNTADFLIVNMAFFFLPAIINILECYSLLAPVMVKLFFVCMVSTMVSFGTAYAVSVIIRRKIKETA